MHPYVIMLLRRKLDTKELYITDQAEIQGLQKWIQMSQLALRCKTYSRMKMTICQWQQKEKNQLLWNTCLSNY